MSIERKRRAKLLQDSFGPGVIDAQNNISLCCPNCKPKPRPDKKKLVVHLEKGWFHCWVCSFSGKNPLYLFRKYAAANLRQCAELFNCAQLNVNVKQEEAKPKVAFPGDAKLVAGSSDPDAKAIVSYLKSRGLSILDMYRWRVCYSNEFRFRRKAIFPSFDSEGNINYYVARAIDETKYKYNNAKIAKSTIIFNEIDVDWSQPVILVEGVFDAIKCPDNAVPVLGSTLPKSSLLFEMLKRHQSTVIIAFDEDAENKAHVVCRNLSKAGCIVFKADIAGEDLGSKTKQDAMEALRTTKRWSNDSMIIHKISEIKSGSIL